jgi:acyl carrier protein
MSLQPFNDPQSSPSVNQPTAPSIPEPNGASSVEAIQAWLVSHLAELLERQPEQIDLHTDFTDYGLNSVEMVNISGEMETFLGHRLDPMLVLEYPNIQVLSEYLGQTTQLVGSTGTVDPASDPQQLLSNLDQLSDEEVDGLLNSMLSEPESE